MASKRDAFNQFLRRTYTVDTFDSRYQSILSINIKTIFTTNIDDLCFKVYEDARHVYLNDLVERGPTYNDRTAVDYVALHGTVAHANDRYTFSTTDIANAFASDPDRWHFLTGQLQHNPILFWGYSLQDAGVLQALHSETTRGRPHERKWIVLREESDAARQLFAAMGFSIIVADTDEMLDYLTRFVQTRSSSEAPKSKLDLTLFPNDLVPDKAAVPVRPIDQFYLGAAPAWYDIYSGAVHKTRYFHEIVNAIYANKNVIVIGIPATGKTTLLMQVAAELKFDGYKLVPGSITSEKARHIVKALNGHRAAVFVDQFADDMAAFNILVEAPNVVAVGFDREHNFERGSHLLEADPQTYLVINVTVLGQLDIQAIYDQLPQRIRASRLKTPQVHNSEFPSLLEFIDANIASARMTLKQRFQEVLKSMKVKNDTDAHDALVMICYVSACGVPVAYDTISAFLRGSKRTYSEISELVHELGQIILEYVGGLADTGRNRDQDYYVPRSRIVAESVLEHVKGADFKRVLTRFHEQVSPYRIVRYDAFKRNAFDKRHALKAFPNWQEGMSFYEAVYDRDNSPFLLQQCALYLSEKKQYTEAFRKIDKAVFETGNRIPSIRNSHAIILFDANINRDPNDATVRQTLQRSMEILHSCYNTDRRKTYHAERFGHQAIKYYEIYGDEDALEYLNTSLRWLREEERRPFPNYRIRGLKKRIEALVQ